MLIAQKTKENNIAEHVIYMFQIEDIIRANTLDLDTIYYSIIQPQIKDEELAGSYKQWYGDLIKQMKSGGVEKTGHIDSVNEILMELLMLHNTLLNLIKEKKYVEVFEKALPVLKDFQQKSNSANINLIEVGFNALYAKIILKLKKQEISQASEEGFAAISELLGHLAAYYKKMKKGELNYPNN
ncbi:MAG: DUF4924 family protein [Flavobacteriales bacterium]|nr:DUF4924 family protein [Flavobacteriales bacterium]